MNVNLSQTKIENFHVAVAIVGPKLSRSLAVRASGQLFLVK
jgi:hypothetical protein